MNKSMQFRNYLAEHGIEMTPDEAAKIYKKAKIIHNSVKNMTQEEIWKVGEGLDSVEKQILEILHLGRF